MGILQVTLFGGVHVTHNDWITEAKLTRETQVLLAYFLLHRDRVHPRNVLTGLFWGEQSDIKAHRAFNTALWRLKKAIEPDGIPTGTYITSTETGEVGFNRESQYWLDVQVFEQGVRNLLTHPTQAVEESNAQELEKLLDLYTDELLNGFYDDWALRERERLRAMYLKYLICLMHHYRFHGLYEKAGTYGRKILNLDPIREDIHRELMKIYLENGQRALAARQYEICRLTLAIELGISPMEETQTLYSQNFPEARERKFLISSKEPRDFDQLLVQLHQVSHTIDLAREQVQQTIQVIKKYNSTND